MTRATIVAATGCPTGIAHTFMAQESLEIAARKLGVDIKVETHGQIGIENALSPEEIAAADGVIVAADKDVQAYRFAGKRLVDVGVKKGITEPEALIRQILDQTASIMPGATAPTATKTSPTSTPAGTRGHLRTIYKHLMNGVSHMLPFVVGGGVLVAISFLWGIYSADPTNEQYNEIAAAIKTIGGLAMSLMVPVLAAYIAESIAKRPGLVVGFVTGLLAANSGAGFLGGIIAGFISGYGMLLIGRLLASMPKALDGLKAIFLYPLIGIGVFGAIIYVISKPLSGVSTGLQDFLVGFQNSNPIILGILVGAMCAFDMGGPVNKAAYVTGTALLAGGNFEFMAGVSAACITPPLVTGFAALFFKKAFDNRERNAAYVNFILGSTHITEGAIPFAARNPIVVIPILMVASSISAVLTYLFGVGVPAPHGGFLVLPVVIHPLLWVVAILAGSIAGGLAYGAWKSRQPLEDEPAENLLLDGMGVRA